jgi:formyl-CoA transferase
MRHRVACAPVRDLTEVVNDPHLHERGMLQKQDHPELGPIVVQHSPLRYLGTELGRSSRAARSGPTPRRS